MVSASRNLVEGKITLYHEFYSKLDDGLYIDVLARVLYRREILYARGEVESIAIESDIAQRKRKDGIMAPSRRERNDARELFRGKRNEERRYRDNV